MVVGAPVGRVSVALCTFNGARFVRAQLDSIARQTRRPDLLVVVDDASTDGTPDLVRAFAAQAQLPVRLEVNAKTLGTTGNFERALSLCDDGVNFLADQDDVWREDKVERVLAAFAADARTLLVHSNARLVDAAQRDLGETLAAALRLTERETAGGAGQQGFRTLLCRNTVTGCTAAARSGVLRWARPFPPGWLHDEWLAIIAAAFGGLAWIDEPLVSYRQHAASQLGVTRHRGLAGLRRLLAGRDGVRATFVPRMERLLDRLQAFEASVAPEVIGLAAEALAFARFRSALPATRLARVVPVARRWGTGAYGRFGRGMRTVLVDLLETIPRTSPGS